MSNGEGYHVTLALIVGFIVMALFGMVMIALGKATSEGILSFYGGLGILAKLFGLNETIQAWVATRGQTQAVTGSAEGETKA